MVPSGALTADDAEPRYERAKALQLARAFSHLWWSLENLCISTSHGLAVSLAHLAPPGGTVALRDKGLTVASSSTSFRDIRTPPPPGTARPFSVIPYQSLSSQRQHTLLPLSLWNLICLPLLLGCGYNTLRHTQHGSSRSSRRWLHCCDTQEPSSLSQRQFSGVDDRRPRHWTIL